MLPTTWCRVSVILTLYMYSTTADGCPTWFYYSNTTGHAECECGQLFSGKIQCNKQEKMVEIRAGFCASRADIEDGLYYAGDCLFGHTSNMTNRVFSELPTNPDQLNEAMCGPYNRRGLLCGRCIDGYGPAVYSLDRRCVNCSSLSVVSAISLYLFLEFFPITVFFLIVVLFRLNITGGPMLGYVLFCQWVMTYLQEYPYLYEYILSRTSPPLQVLFYITLALCDFWTLQVFRFHPFCISEKLTGIHVHMLSLLTPVYPVLLVVITCIVMELHARDCKLTRFIWKPFATCLAKFNIAVATGSSVIHAFATFILLSASTVINNGSSILLGFHVYRSTNGTVYKKVLYVDPTIVPYSQKHIPYMLTAIVLFISLALLPSLLLCLYPTRIYRALSRLVSARKRLAVTIFTEALHSCFKDGLNGTWDYRGLAGLATLSHIVLVIISYIVSIIAYKYRREFSYGFSLILMSLIFSYARPFKFTIANFSFSYHFIIMGTLSIAFGLWIGDLHTKTTALMTTFVILPALSHFLVFTWAGYRLIRCLIPYMKHCGFTLKDTLTKFTSAVKQGFRKSRGDYQLLRDTVTQ